MNQSAAESIGFLQINKNRGMMSLYMFKATYTSASIKAMVENPTDRSGLIAKACDTFGGKMLQFLMAFGEDDAIVICELPDDVAAAAIAAQVAASGGCSRINTIQLLSVEDWVKACTMARDVASGYAAPSK